MNASQKVIIFDGECGLCNRWVRFVARRDTARIFSFTTAGTGWARAAFERLKIDPDLTAFSIVLVEGERVSLRSTAALRILSFLPGIWRHARIFLAFPPFLRDPVYDLVARLRYRIWGRVQSCGLLGEEERSRLIE